MKDAHSLYTRVVKSKSLSNEVLKHQRKEYFTADSVFMDRGHQL